MKPPKTIKTCKTKTFEDFNMGKPSESISLYLKNKDEKYLIKRIK